MLSVLSAFQRFSGSSGTYTVTLQDGIGRQSGVDLSVIRDTTPPTLTLEAVVQSNVLVAWNVEDSGSGVDASTCLLEVREDDGDWQTFSTECGGEDATYEGQPGHTYTFRLSASDNVSNAASTEVEALVPYVKKYYYANGQRVAMRQEGVVYYVHSDHLGSTSILSDGGGQRAGDRVAYLPYGGVRLGEASTLPTDYGFTGQRLEVGLGLMHYGARFYNPRLGRFVSADSIVPTPGDPQALNRYAYVLNNPVIYIDLSGHCIPGVDCPGDLPEPDWRPSTDPRSMSQEEYIEYLLWTGVYFEREEAETGGTIGLSLSRDNLNFELGTALAKYMAQGGEASWQAAIGGDPFIVYAVAQFGSQLGEDAYLALGQAYQSRATQQSALVNYPSLEIDSQRMPEIADGIKDAQSRGAPDILTRTTDRAQIARNRAEATGGFSGVGSPDEYPFASTMEGGSGAFVKGVPLSEQRIQGGALSTFYRVNDIGHGDKFRVIVR